MSDSHFDRNEHGLWCPSCGELIAAAWHDDEGFAPDQCRVCGYPDDIEMMAQFHCGDE